MTTPKQIRQLALAAMLLAGLAASAPGLARADRVMDPMIKIVSPDLGIKVDFVLSNLVTEVSKAVGLDKSLISYYWLKLETVYTAGEKTTGYPIFVDIYAPCFLDNETIAKLMTALADSLARHTTVDRKWIFIHTHRAESGLALLSNEIQYCDDEPENSAR